MYTISPYAVTVSKMTSFDMLRGANTAKTLKMERKRNPWNVKALANLAPHESNCAKLCEIVRQSKNAKVHVKQSGSSTTVTAINNLCFILR